MSTLVAEPVVVQEAPAESHFTPEDLAISARDSNINGTVEPKKEEMHPMVSVLIACLVAFFLATAMIGSLTAWIYQLRHSGAFAP